MGMINIPTQSVTGFFPACGDPCGLLRTEVDIAYGVDVLGLQRCHYRRMPPLCALACLKIRW